MNHEYATGQYRSPPAIEQFTHLTVHVVTTAGKLIPDPRQARFRHIICSSLVQIRP